nr:MAG TPA: hypothetical protein [Bacteriophage sp.]
MLLAVNLYDLASYCGFHVDSLILAANNILSLDSIVAAVNVLSCILLNSSIVIVFITLPPVSLNMYSLVEDDISFS